MPGFTSYDVNNLSKEMANRKEVWHQKLKREASARRTRLIEELVLAHVSSGGLLREVNLELMVEARRVAHMIIEHSGPEGFDGH